MANLRDKIRFLLESLSLELEQGFGFLKLAQGIGRVWAAERASGKTQLVELVYEACLREALLTLAKLSISEKESITVEYLLNCALEVPGKVFSGATREEIEQSVAGHRRQMEHLSPLIAALKMRRDRVLAHIDRKHVNEPEVLTARPIALNEVEEAFGILENIINTYRRYFGMPELSVAKTGQILSGEIALLADYLAQQGPEN